MRQRFLDTRKRILIVLHPVKVFSEEVIDPKQRSRRLVVLVYNTAMIMRALSISPSPNLPVDSSCSLQFVSVFSMIMAFADL